MNALDLVNLPPSMARTSGRSEVRIGLIDGPVVMDHPDLPGDTMVSIAGRIAATCADTSASACRHGTFVAGILAAKRGSPAPGICPGCTLLVRPIFPEANPGGGHMPSASPEELARAILDAIDAGARVLNVSAAVGRPSVQGQRLLEAALDHAARRQVLVIVAAGNRGALGGSSMTGHPWVIPVVAYDMHGSPSAYSNFGRSIGQRGLGAAGESIAGLGAGGMPLTLGGTSAAAPFVTGAIALLLSEFPAATPVQIRWAATLAGGRRRTSVVPPLLDAWAAYRALQS